jgi:hypothetical protein
MVQKIAAHLGMQDEIDESVEELSKETDVNRVAESIEEKTGDK